MEWWRFYFSGIWCIYILGLFACADALLEAAVSAMPWYSPLQMLFFRLMYLQLAFLWTYRCFLHCLSCTIASSTCPFYTLQILPAKILHPQSALSTPCRYSQLKFCILTSRKSTITDISPILWTLFTSWPEPIHDLQKIDIRNSSEYGASVGDT